MNQGNQSAWLRTKIQLERIKFFDSLEQMPGKNGTDPEQYLSGTCRAGASASVYGNVCKASWAMTSQVSRFCPDFQKLYSPVVPV